MDFYSFLMLVLALVGVAGSIIAVCEFTSRANIRKVKHDIFDDINNYIEKNNNIMGNIITYRYVKSSIKRCLNDMSDKHRREVLREISMHSIVEDVAHEVANNNQLRYKYRQATLLALLEIVEVMKRDEK